MSLEMHTQCNQKTENYLDATKSVRQRASNKKEKPFGFKGHSYKNTTSMFCFFQKFSEAERGV